jgi:Ca2+-binding EF-hand superfamily protein
MSDKIVEAIKWKRLEDIFNLMDSDNDGVICNFFFDNKKVTRKLISVGCRPAS